MNESNDKCAHPSCQCRAMTGSNFCSTFCEGQGETLDILCGCGHNGCAEALPWVPEIAPAV